MHKTHASRALSTSAAMALAITAFSITPAFANGSGSSGDSLLRSQLVGSKPASPAVAGIKPGGFPWVNGLSPVRVREDGRISVKITGLVIPQPPGTGVNPIAAVVATLVCGQTVEHSTAPFALSAAGNGATSEVIAVPRDCDNPAVLVQPAGNRTAYIASAFGEDRTESDG